MCTFEYNMSAELAKTLIKAAKKPISNRQKYLVDTVNEQFGLKCTVVKVNTSL